MASEDTSRHFHVLARTAGGPLSGDARRLVIRDVRQALDGTGAWATQPGIEAALAGRIEFGYAVHPHARGWLCVISCAGADSEQCRQQLTTAAIGGDIRLQDASDRTA